jgi:hypothetical protein
MNQLPVQVRWNMLWNELERALAEAGVVGAMLRFRRCGISCVFIQPLWSRR